MKGESSSFKRKQLPYKIINPLCKLNSSQRNLNVHKMVSERPGLLLNVLCTFN